MTYFWGLLLGDGADMNGYLLVVMVVVLVIFLEPDDFGNLTLFLVGVLEDSSFQLYYRSL